MSCNSNQASISIQTSSDSRVGGPFGANVDTFTYSADLYSIDNGQTWSSDSIFSNLPVGTYYPQAWDTTNNCAVSWPDPVEILPYEPPQILDVDILSSGSCSSTRIAVIHFTSNFQRRFDFSIDGGQTYQESAFFDITQPGEYTVIARDPEHPQCQDTLVWQSGPINQGVLQIDSVITAQPSCIDSTGSITIHADPAVDSYSIDSGATWQASNFFPEVQAGEYLIHVHSSSANCQVQYGDTIKIEPYMHPRFVTVWWSPLYDTVCGGANGRLYVDADVQSFGSNHLEYSIDGGQTFHDSAVFINVLEGSYKIIIRDEVHHQCADTVQWQSGTLPQPPTILGITPDSVGSCHQGEVEIQALGRDLRYSLDGVTFSQDSLVMLSVNSPQKIFVQSENSQYCIDSAEVTLFASDIELEAGVEVTGADAELSILIPTKGPYTYQWSTGQTATTAVQNLPSGVHHVVITDGFGCQVTVAFVVEDSNCTFAIVDSIVRPSCQQGGEIHLIAQDAQPYTFTWQDDPTLSDSVRQDLDQGTYAVTISYASCSEERQFVVPAPSDFPNVATLVKHVSCSTPLATLEVIVYDTGTYYLDLANEDFQDSIHITGLPVGRNEFLLLNTATGCTFTGSVEVRDLQVETSDLNIEIRQPQCEGEGGIFTIVNDSVSEMGHLVWINGVEYGDQFTVEDLAPGEYAYRFLTWGGCVLEDTLTIEEPGSQLTVRADTTITAGDPVILWAIAPDSSSITWSAPHGELCSCTEIAVQPTKSATYSVELEFPSGCLLRRDVRIDVEGNSSVFVPNAITPNGDGINDKLQVFLSPDLRFERIQIFNRWGSQVYSSESDPGWRGEDEHGGVFIYVLTLKNEAQGRQRVESGSVTLLK